MGFNDHQRQYMQRCLDLAQNGLGKVAPNPMVGAVIIHDNRIIGEGYHQHFGSPHAEVVAINSVSEKNQPLLTQSTIYVNLEPCSHFGKTPPCTDLILEKKIPEVVISNTDPNPLVSKKGIEKLRDHGCIVTTGLLENEGHWLNRLFFTYHEAQRPYVVLKWAQSEDGFFTRNLNEQHWITGTTTKRVVHKWRSEEMAIIVGMNTVIVDNPELTTRHWPGKNPVRVVIDKDLTLPKDRQIFNGSAPTLIFTEKDAENRENLRYFKVAFNSKLPVAILQQLYQEGIQSVMIEGGIKLLRSFIEAELWDEARILTGTEYFGQGIYSPEIAGEKIAEDMIGEDRLVILKRRNINKR